MLKALTILTLVVLASCAQNKITQAIEDEKARSAATTNVPQQNITIQFAAKVGAQVFNCAGPFTAGSSNSTLTPKDFRFYIHDIRLVRSSGVEVAVTLTQDGTYQYQNLAFMDFEPGCSAQGNAAVHTAVTGTIAASEPLTFSKIRFRLGVPQNLNHLNAATQPAPLNVTYMFWTWLTGFKHVVIEFDVASFTPFFAHLGSIDCSGTVPDVTCDYPNRPDIELSFTYGQTVVADAKELFKDTDFTVANTAGTQPGCHSDRSDPECKALINNWGANFSYTGTSTARGLSASSVMSPAQYNTSGQTFFRVE